MIGLHSIDWLQLTLWSIATFGIVGTILLLLLAPGIAGVIFQAIANAFTTLLRSRVGCALVAGAACLIIGAVWADRTANARCKAATQRAALEAIHRDDTIRADLQKELDTSREELDKLNTDLTQKVADYETSIAKLTDAQRTCRGASADDVSRLRRFR